MFAQVRVCLAAFCRMSISWSRLIPGGVTGSPASPEGVKFYKSVFEELKKNGIEPAVTLYHWDMPQVRQRGVGILTTCSYPQFTCGWQLQQQLQIWCNHKVFACFSRCQMCYLRSLESCQSPDGSGAAELLLVGSAAVMLAVQVLQDKYEGFLSSQSQDDFAYYAETAFKL